MNSSAYSWLMLLGIVVSIVFWSRLARRDERLLIIYISALIGAFFGAKLIYIAAEGWLHFGAPDMWLQLATGKTILGAFLGGYISVELAKKPAGYTQSTGDWFAIIAPVGIIVGRIGCLLHGCCLGNACTRSWFTMDDRDGVARWPAVPIEIGFNVLAIVALWILRRMNRCRGQHFHLYLMAYGVFRFGHEFFRSTPKIVLGLSGYHFAALAVFLLGVVGFVRRARVGVPAGQTTPSSVVS